MIKREYSVSSIQIFFIMFSFVFSGLFLYGEGSLTRMIFAPFFLSVICLAAGTVCEGYHGSAMFYNATFGKMQMIFKTISLIFLFISAIKDISSFSLSVAAFYGGKYAYIIFLAVIAICVFAVWRDTLGAARFCELCLFPVSIVILLSLLGERDSSFYLAISEKDVFSAFDIIGCTSVIFSLYLRVITPKNDDMSDFARNSAFHPSPMYCGALAPIFALAVYITVIFLGVRSNILANALIWFCHLARCFASAVCARDLCGFAECSVPSEKAHRFAAMSTAFAASILILQFVPERAFSCVAILYNALFPCVAFVCCTVKGTQNSGQIY